MYLCEAETVKRRIKEEQESWEYTKRFKTYLKDETQPEPSTKAG
jgi:hypothetical protein